MDTASETQEFVFTATKDVIAENGKALHALAQTIASNIGTNVGDLGWDGRGSCQSFVQINIPDNNPKELVCNLCLEHINAEVGVYFHSSKNTGWTVHNYTKYAVVVEKLIDEKISSLQNDIKHYLTTGIRP